MKCLCPMICDYVPSSITSEFVFKYQKGNTERRAIDSYGRSECPAEAWGWEWSWRFARMLAATIGITTTPSIDNPSTNEGNEFLAKVLVNCFAGLPRFKTLVINAWSH
eukprot:4624679-Amphidinium_carterae.1